VKYAWLLLGVFAARFFATAIAYPQVDGDLSWQRWLGRTIARSGAIPRTLGRETFSAAGVAWTPQEWLFSLAAAHATGGVSWTLFAGGIAACALAALALAAWHAVRRGASDRAVAACVVLAGIGFFASFGVRVQVAAWPLLALFALLLDVEGPWAYAAIAVAAIWSNVHASAMLAPIVAAIAAVGTFMDERRASPAVRRLALIAVGSALAICANPFGPELPRYALSLFGSPIKAQINEWRAPDLGDPTFALGALPLLILACVAIPAAQRRRTRDVALLIAFAYLLLGAARNIALFGIVALPIVAPALGRSFAFFRRESRDDRAERIARFALPAFGLVVSIVVGIGLLRSTERTKDDLATHAIAAAARLPGERHLFCSDFAWCGLAVGTPRLRVFLDGRADPYPLAVWRGFETIVGIRPGWRETLARYDVDTIVASSSEPLDRMLALAPPPAWHRVYADRNYRVWARDARAALSPPRGTRAIPLRAHAPRRA